MTDREAISGLTLFWAKHLRCRVGTRFRNRDFLRRIRRKLRHHDGGLAAGVDDPEEAVVEDGHALQGWAWSQQLLQSFLLITVLYIELWSLTLMELICSDQQIGTAVEHPFVD